jgi:S1-C subfamily serine protease
MATFEFEAVKTSGAEVRGSVDGVNQAEALQKIRQMGYFATRITEVAGADKGKKGYPYLLAIFVALGTLALLAVCLRRQKELSGLEVARCSRPACPSLTTCCAKERSRLEVARAGKAATALVESSFGRGKGFGSSFCIHPSGWFITNAHVVDKAHSVALVLNPALKAQKVIKATVLRLDRARDLALLRAEGVKGLPALPLGSAEALEELTEVFAFGFSFGTALAVARGEYPAVTVNAGSITSLRRRTGRLHRIQTDLLLNHGNSGGPVLDRNGRVVGIVVSGVPEASAGRRLVAGLNFAIPVSHLVDFLTRS